MSKIKNLLVTIAVLLLIPFNVFAGEKINVYIFKGDGCGYCANALSFFEGLNDEYKSYFNLVEKEVWYDEDNSELMEDVSAYFGENVTGVPYIVIGEKSFQGYTAEFDSDIKVAIKAGYENEDGSYKDVIETVLKEPTVKKDKDNSAVTIIIILAVFAGIGFLIYIARDDESEEVIEKVKKETNNSTKKNTTAKKNQKKKTNKK